MAYRPGDEIVLREVWRGRVFEARPMIVVLDDPEQTMLLLPGDVGCGVPIGADGRALRLPDRPWHLEVRSRGAQPILSFAWPETPYSVLLWPTDDERRVWYVNLQDPLTRTPIGFDTVDHVLDALIELDRSSWRWKDEDELSDAVSTGLFSAEEAATFRSWGERAVERILRRDPPFDREWDRWRPDPAWRAPRLPAGWDAPPG
jgi:predicted RNA-binding protein associated with RNAse of E/G family